MTRIKIPKKRVVYLAPSSSSSEEDDETSMEEEEQGVDQKAPQLSHDAESKEGSEGDEEENNDPKSPSSSESTEDESDSETANHFALQPHLTLKPDPLSPMSLERSKLSSALQEKGSKMQSESRKEDCSTAEGMAEMKNGKKRTAYRDEEVEKKKHKTAVEAIDKRTVLVGKGGQTTVELKAKKNASMGNQTMVRAGTENKKEDFQSKYPHFIKSINKKNYPFGNEELFDRFKEKAAMLDCSVAGELEEKWVEVWEEYGKLCEKVANIASMQIVLLNGA